MRNSIIQMQRESKYFEKYRTFMGEGAHDHQFAEPQSHLLKQYRIELVSSEQLNDRLRKFDVRLSFLSERGNIAEYIVDLGRFRVTVNLLNLQGNSPTTDANMGRGSFGTVVVKSVNGTEFVAKVMKRERMNQDEMEDFICEVAISKLCAMFQIGPDVETSIPFDLIVYDNAAQFHLEKCETIFKHSSFFNNSDQFMRDLNNRLKMLHSLHIAHKDIKPDNILYSPTRQKYLLCDFGCAEYVREDIGGVSRTNFAGTPRYMGPEMVGLQRNREKKVDLYYNDVFACDTLLIMLESQKNQKIVQQQKISSIYDKQSFLDPEQGNSKVSKNYPDFKIGSSNISQQQTPSLTNSSDVVEHSTSKQSTEQPVGDVNQAFKEPDSYEFYRLLFAATALNEHNFNLEENLPKLTKEQKIYIQDILMKSLNRDKMDQVLKELKTVKSNDEMLIGLQNDFEMAYEKNFPQHMPRPSNIPTVTREWVGNIMRLFGKTEKLKELMSASAYSAIRPQRIYEILVEIVRDKKYQRLISCFELIVRQSKDFLKQNEIEQDQLSSVCSWIIIGRFSYDTKEFLLRYIIKALRQPTKPRQLFLQRLAAIMKKKEKAVNLLQYLSSEPQTRFCVCLAFLHYRLGGEENSVEMLEVCTQLLGRLTKQNTIMCFMETLNIRRIQFMVRSSRLELDHRAVKLYYEESLELLFRHSNNHDARSILGILAERLNSYQQFRLPLEDKRVAHLEFEKCRQFYSGMQIMNVDMLVMNMYRNELPVPVDVVNSELDTEMIKLDRQRDSLINQGNIRTLMEGRKRREAARIEQQHQSGQGILSQRDTFQVIQEVDLLWNLGQVKEADRLLRSIQDRALASPHLFNHRNYYHKRAQVNISMDKHQEAYECCLKAIDFNNRLGGDKDQVDTAYDLQKSKAEICGHLGRFQESIDILDELRRESQNNGQRPDYRKLAVNYIATAQTFRAMGRLHDSLGLCSKVFELEQWKLVHPQRSVLAHLRMARIYGDLKQSQKQIPHSWKAIQKTKTIGNGSSCLAYTNILRAFQPMLGNQALSFISYARKSTDPPRDTFRGNQIDERLYQTPVPSGQLPLDMSTADFIQEAEARMRTMPFERHSSCFFFKNQLLDAILGKIDDQPEYRLLYVRTLIEILLHKFVAKDIQFVMEKLPDTIEQMIDFKVSEHDRQSKAILAEFAEDILLRSIQAATKEIPECPQSTIEQFNRRRNRTAEEQC